MDPLGHSSVGGAAPAPSVPLELMPVPPLLDEPPEAVDPALPLTLALPAAPADLPEVDICAEPAALLLEPAPLPLEGPFSWSSAGVSLVALLSLAVNLSPLHAATDQHVTNNQAPM